MKTVKRNAVSGWVMVTASMMILGLTSCKASKPGSFESNLVHAWKRHVTVGDKNVKNPVADTKENVAEGQGHFGHHCQVCHGYDGQNTGVPFAENMSPPVADLASKEIQAYTDGQLKWIIKNGIKPSGMPAWPDDPTDDEQWKIVLFIRHLPAKGSLGAPDVYKEDEEQHQEMEKGGKSGEMGHMHEHGTSEKTTPKQDESKPHTHKH
jgi:mono/diheme cytochrome c family protein